MAKRPKSLGERVKLPLGPVRPKPGALLIDKKRKPR